MEAEARALLSEVDAAMSALKIEELKAEQQELTEKSKAADFWQDSVKAGAVMQRISLLEKRIRPWSELKESINDLVELSSMDDPKLSADLDDDLKTYHAQFSDLRQQLMLAGPYDDHGAVVTISAGAGGTDAQDWTQILFRMYSRYIERQGWQQSLVEESPGEEAGLKSVVFEVKGEDFVYGKLKSEHGVHRLVRLSPFNSDNLRQTSFAKVEVSPLINSPSEVEIDEKELKIDVYRSGGHGGQSVNTTDSAVRITHLPSGITVAIQNERSQLQNREMAMAILRSRLVQLSLQQHAAKISELKGPNQSAEWGNQIRSYVMHPYKQVKDLRTRFETSDIDGVLDGAIDEFIDRYLKHSIGDTA